MADSARTNSGSVSTWYMTPRTLVRVRLRRLAVSSILSMQAMRRRREAGKQQRAKTDESHPSFLLACVLLASPPWLTPLTLQRHGRARRLDSELCRGCFLPRRAEAPARSRCRATRPSCHRGFRQPAWTYGNRYSMIFPRQSSHAHVGRHKGGKSSQGRHAARSSSSQSASSSTSPSHPLSLGENLTANMIYQEVQHAVIKQRAEVFVNRCALFLFIGHTLTDLTPTLNRPLSSALPKDAQPSPQQHVTEKHLSKSTLLTIKPYLALFGELAGENPVSCPRASFTASFLTDPLD